jgi:hypothetical protein
MKKFTVNCSRHWLEQADVTIEAESEEDAREIAGESLSDGTADEWDWRQMGIEDEAVESVTEES